MNLNDAPQALEALRRARATGSPDAIARAAMDNAWPLFSAHYEEFVAAVESLPNSLLEKYPVLRTVHRMTPVLARSTRPFKPLVSPDAARLMSPDELDVLTLAQMVSFRFSGDVAAALIFARRLEERILQIRVESRDRVDGPLWYYHYQIGSTLLAAGDSSRALLEFATARQLGRLAPQPDAERLALARAALAHAVRGSVEDAEHALAEIAGHPPPTAAHVAAAKTTERTAAALIAVERMADGIEKLLAGLEPYDSIHLTWPFALLARARWLLARRRPDEALEAARLAAGAHPAQHGSFASDVVHATTVDALWGMGDATMARREAEVGERTGVLTAFATVRLALHQTRLDAAARGMHRISAHRSLGPAQRSELQLLSAWLEMLRTDAISRQTAERVARTAARTGSRRMMSALPRQVVELIRSVLEPAQATCFDLATAGLDHVDAHRRPLLTEGELRVLHALPSEGTTAAIAAALHLSPNTVKTHLKAVYRKLGCASRGEAIKVALHLGLLPVDPPNPVRDAQPQHA